MTTVLSAPLALVAAAAFLLVSPNPARANVSIQADEIGSYDLPEGFDTNRARFASTTDGRTYIAAFTGETEEDLACTVVVADGAEATALSYRFDDQPTDCFGLEPHPDGGFFLRGYDMLAAQEERVSGFTAYFDESGEVVWVVDDRDFAGESDFFGNYIQPSPTMTYSAEIERLLSFSESEFVNGSVISQGQVIDGDGDVREPGWDPPTGTGSPGLIAGATTRINDGLFFIYIYVAGDQGAHFFTYNGRNSNSYFDPLGDREIWESRFVHGLDQDEAGNVYLMWTPADDDSGTPTEVSAVDDEGTEIWTERWDSQVEVDFSDETVDLGLPSDLWAGDDYLLLRYGVGGDFVLRVVDASDGSEIGVVSLVDLTEFEPLEVLEDENGGFRLLVEDAADARAYEFRLDVEADKSSGNGGSGGDGDGDGGGGASNGDEGCSASATGAPVPLGGVLLAIALAVITIARRQRLSTNKS